MLEESVQVLCDKKLLLYPTDTVWGIGGDATDVDVVKRIYSLKERANNKAMIGLVATIDMLSAYIEDFPNAILPYLEEAQPTTVIYEGAKGFAENLIGTDGSIALRIPKHDFCLQLIQAFGKPIISTSANISGQPTPKDFQSIDRKILEGVDYIVPLDQEKTASKPSRIIKIDRDGAIEIIRE